VKETKMLPGPRINNAPDIKNRQVTATSVNMTAMNIAIRISPIAMAILGKNELELGASQSILKMLQPAVQNWDGSKPPRPVTPWPMASKLPRTVIPRVHALVNHHQANPKVKPSRTMRHPISEGRRFASYR
jgi:hypothetical protein